MSLISKSVLFNLRHTFISLIVGNNLWLYCSFRKNLLTCDPRFPLPDQATKICQLQFKFTPSAPHPIPLPDSDVLCMDVDPNPSTVGFLFILNNCIRIRNTDLEAYNQGKNVVFGRNVFFSQGIIIVTSKPKYSMWFWCLLLIVWTLNRIRSTSLGLFIDATNFPIYQ